MGIIFQLAVVEVVETKQAIMVYCTEVSEPQDGL